jgi:hypothetical protein
MRIDISKVNKNISKNPKFLENGVELIKSFISKDKILELNQELEECFNQPIFNSNYGSIWTGDEFFPGKKILKIIPNISRIRSINILELVVDIANLIPNKKNIILTDINIYSEKRNKESLFWHTDGRKGMMRAQIYIKGGGKDSGAFQYIQNTHSIDHQVDHKLNNKEILELKDNIYNCYGEGGDLLLFNTYGFHAKNKCIDERINLMIEFQPKDLVAIRSSIDLNNLNLTKKVLENLDLFIPNEEMKKKSYHSNYGLDIKYKNFPTYFVSRSIKLILKKIVINFFINPSKILLKKIKLL